MVERDGAIADGDLAGLAAKCPERVLTVARARLSEPEPGSRDVGELRRAIGLALVEQGQFDRALGELTAAARLLDRPDQVLLAIAWVYSLLGEPRRCIATITELLPALRGS
ncbi:MAG: hypothetical protein ACRDRL_21330, partial [Sciscionella sp.]